MVRIADRLDMTSAVYRGRKVANEKNQNLGLAWRERERERERAVFFFAILLSITCYFVVSGRKVSPSSWCLEKTASLVCSVLCTCQTTIQ